MSNQVVGTWLTRSLQLLLALILGAMLVAGPVAVQARADDTAASYEIEAQLASDGALTVNATVTLGETKPETLRQAFRTRRPATSTSDYVYTITDLKASAGGNDLGATVSDDGDDKVIEINTAAVNNEPIVISYKVVGAVAANEKPDEHEATTTFAWHFLQGLNVGVTSVTGSINTSAPVSWIDCRSGNPVAPGACSNWQAGTHEAPVPTFEDGPRGANEVVMVTFISPASLLSPNEQIDHRWTLDRAFTFSWPTALAALGALLLGALALWSLHRRAGRDIAALSHPTLVAEFAPVGEGESEFSMVSDVRPGQIGTVADERVDPVDVTGTLLDLAVRGHLRIEQLPNDGHSPMDWSFTRLEGGRGELHPYETLLLDAVAPKGGDPVLVSHISEAVGPVIPEVQDALYDDVVAQGWFDKRPDAARNTFAIAGWVTLVVALVALGLLVAFTTYGLLGLALVAVAVGLLWVSQLMPRRSARGSELLAGLHGFASLLQHQRTDQMPKGRELHEISELLPYAVVLGGKDRWIEALVAADGDEEADSKKLDWYHAPDDWHLHHLPASLDSFITVVQGRLFSR
ncbi:DUF2207 domain-containing protein [Propionibacteriaceae bacterium Y1923]